jgi:hypothetical protein
MIVSPEAESLTKPDSVASEESGKKLANTELQVLRTTKRGTVKSNILRKSIRKEKVALAEDYTKNNFRVSLAIITECHCKTRFPCNDIFG